MALAGSLDALVIEHDFIGSPLRDHLVPGRSPAEVEAALTGLGLVPPSELIDLFTWHDIEDGPDDPARVDWFWPAAPLRLEEAVRDYRKAMEIGGATAADVEAAERTRDPVVSTMTGFWRNDWFPILGGGDTYAIECRLDGERDARGAIWRVNWHPDPDFQTVQVGDSLTDVVDDVVELFRAGAYAWDPDHRAVVTVDEVFVRLGLGRLYRPWP